ncbi:adenylate kinase family protein [Candidatus Micrarchaeota archaeon]|nr:adenylate kinase family protein [Candidatus Micrarchaeota archaeon]
MRIVITGVPGTGKSTLAKKIAGKTCAELVELNELVKEKKLFTKTWKDGTLEADLKKLEREVKKIFLKGRKRNVIVEGHLACEMKLKVDAVIVLRANPKILEKRLKKRGYAKKKIEENVLAEMLDYCTVKSIENFKKAKIFEVETSASEQENAKKIIGIIAGSGRQFRVGCVDWSEELKEYV